MIKNFIHIILLIAVLKGYSIMWQSACSIKDFQAGCLFNVAEFPITTSKCLALVIATFILRSSMRNPRDAF